ncbi:MAG: leucine--tRNA ligase [Bacteroidetes bacterium]|nr:leucine--tRNA ligase [Bacteroidota bacterium]
MKNFSNNSYQPESFESYWREKWEKEKLYSVDNKLHKGKLTYYCLDMFPYPSGSGLHVGHWRGYVLSDVWSRYKILKGFNVLHPMGWDNFGLPAEIDAIKKGIHPKISTQKNINNMKRQLKEIGCVYDWNREIDTTDPEYYRWTQWIFLKMYKKGLAYQKLQPVNWCNHCNVVLSNEEVEGGRCERCGGDDIEKKNIKQWMLKITEYAERLLNDLDDLDWPEKVKEMQRNWIGRSEGAKVLFTIVKDDEEKFLIDIFTTRPDTLFGATFMVFAPEHPLVPKITTPEKKCEVDDYIKKVQAISNIERQKLDKEKTGVFTGSYAINPVSGKKIPVWISDYVLMGYGSGAIMSVPAHDERDFEFAKKFDLPIIEVIYSDKSKRDDSGKLKEAYTGSGILINSDYLNSLSVEDAKKQVIRELSEKGLGEFSINYKLRDWIFARQRYWGEPIPIIHCDKCGTVPVPEDDLPVKLPNVKAYQPTNDAKSPLATISDWVNTKCPKCDGKATRETDTMPQWAGSSWYFIRYASPHYYKGVAKEADLKKWLPVDMYVGGIEHAVLHLLYARFWTKFLQDEGVIIFNEPFKQLFNQGMICRTAHRCVECNKWIFDKEIKEYLGKENIFCPTCGTLLKKSLEKMSKSKGNGVSPDDLVNEYGTDALRLYELFAGDPNLDSEWNDDGIKGCYSFLKKSWQFVNTCEFRPEPTRKAKQLTHRLIKKIEQRLKAFKFNTSVSAFMEFINEAILIKDSFSKELVEYFLIVLSPFAPHFSEELWQNYLKNEKSIFLANYPEYDDELAKLEEIDVVVQINGKLRWHFVVEPGSSKEKLVEEARKLDNVQKFIANKDINNIIVVPDRIVNFVVNN